MPMKMRSLTAIKPHKYGTRHLTAGEEYEAPPRHAVALVAGKKARFADKPARAPQAKAEVVAEEPAAATAQIHAELEPEPTSNIDSLRMEATQLGIDVDGRWGVARLAYEIQRAKS
jgi:hypothetical protein